MIRRRPAVRASADRARRPVRRRRRSARRRLAPPSVVLVLVVVILALLLLLLLRSPEAPAVLEPSDPVARLLLDSEETRFALWSEHPHRLLEVLVPLLGMERERLQRAMSEAGAGEWFDRLESDLGRLGVRQLAARQEADGSWEVRLEVPPVRAWLVRLLGFVRGDPLLRGGPLGDRGVVVQWQGAIWSARSDVETGRLRATARSASRTLQPLDRRGAEVLVRRRRASGDSAVYRLCPPEERVRDDGSRRLSVTFQRVGGCVAAADRDGSADALGLPTLATRMAEIVDPIPDVFLIALRHQEPSIDGSPARGADALLLLEQERLPNVTQLPSACSVGWNGVRRSLPGARLEGVLDVRVYEQELVPSSYEQSDGSLSPAAVRAYDRASQQACLDLEPPMAKLFGRVEGRELIWVQLDPFARWLADYVRVLDEFRVLPRRWRGSSRWAETLISAMRPGAHLLFVEHQGVWFWQVEQPAASTRR